MPPSIPEHIRSLHHPLELLILELRDLILRSADLQENIKWNAPNYSRLGEDRLTFHFPRNQQTVLLIFHRGAKKSAGNEKPLIRDEKGLLNWLSADRATISLSSTEEVMRHQESISDLISQWIRTGE